MKKFGAFQFTLALMLALAVVAGAWSPALAQDGGQDNQTQQANPLAPGFKNDIFSGRSGIFAAGGLDPKVVTVTKEDTRGDGFGQVRLARNPITIEADSNFLPMTYVYFDLWPWQARAYNNENLKIFYKNENGGWSVCPSFLVNQSANADNGEAEGKARIACIATQPGTYAIGTDNADAVPSIFP